MDESEIPEPAPRRAPEPADDRILVPGPVTATVGLIYIMAGINVLYGAAGIGMAIKGNPEGIAIAVVTLGLAAIMVFIFAKSLREGRRGARLVAILVGSAILFAACSGYGRGDIMPATIALIAVFGLALILLVTVPESSRDWFRRR
jgi:hypothetical protein